MKEELKAEGRKAEEVEQPVLSEVSQEEIEKDQLLLSVLNKFGHTGATVEGL